MHSNWWLTLLARGEALTLAVLIFSFLRMRLANQWPSLMAALLLELTSDLFLMYLTDRPGTYKLYFYSYWITSGMQALLRMGVIADIMRSFPGIGFLPRQVYLFIGLACITMAGASAAYCFRAEHSTAARDLVSTVVLVNHCVNIAWGAFVVALLAGIRLLHLGWSPLGARIASGVFLRICGMATVSQLLVYKSVSIRLFANGLDSVCTIAVLSYLSFAIAMYSPLPPGEPEEERRAAHQSLDALLAVKCSRES